MCLSQVLTPPKKRIPLPFLHLGELRVGRVVVCVCVCVNRERERRDDDGSDGIENEVREYKKRGKIYI